MIIVDCIIAIMYIVSIGFVLYYINKIQMDKLKRDSKPINNVHFYVARDKNSTMYLYLNKPVRHSYRFCSSIYGQVITSEQYFENFNLKTENFKSLKWEDEPVEVFLNLED